MRLAAREPVGPLTAPVVNPTDKYQSKADDLHRYGTWVMGCIPKYVQQFSVWKDELTIYISPAGVIPVFSFLKCTSSPTPSSMLVFVSLRLAIDHPSTQPSNSPLLSSQPSVASGVAYAKPKKKTTQPPNSPK